MSVAPTPDDNETGKDVLVIDFAGEIYRVEPTQSFTVGREVTTPSCTANSWCLNSKTAYGGCTTRVRVWGPPWPTWLGPHAPGLPPECAYLWCLGRWR